MRSDGRTSAAAGYQVQVRALPKRSGGRARRRNSHLQQLRARRRAAGAGRVRGGTDSSSAAATSCSCKRHGEPIPVLDPHRPHRPRLQRGRWTASSASDSVLILPSASLVQSQEELRERINRMTGRAAGCPACSSRPRRPARRARRGRAEPCSLGETIAVAFQSIRANKLRAVLTMLGIIIGVGAVITMVALGTRRAEGGRGPDRGARRQRAHRLRRAGPSSAGSGSPTGRASRTDDYEALRRDATAARARSCPRCSSPSR